MTSEVNVAEVERWASALGGAALAAYGIQTERAKSDPWEAPSIAAAGSTLIYRGATGHCPMYAATGINTAGETIRGPLSGADAA